MFPKLRAALACASIASLSVIAIPRAAHACGGCFNTSSSKNPTQVTSHRMLLSISQQQTTLWDQIQYVGEPEEFAWVLPIKGTVQVGLSSDLLFSQLEAITALTIKSPVVMCPLPGGGSFGAGGTGSPGCSTSGSTKGAAYSASGGGGSFGVQEGEENPVDVLAQEVVGPYETVQLASDDPLALRAWLENHGYAIPMDIEPVIDAYVNEGFGFLALRLVPGTAVDAMRPVRITTPGATPSLPLRMVAAGTGAKTAISLFIVGEGYYIPSNMGYAEIDPYALVWDFDQSRSNYAELRAAYFEASNYLGWLAEAAIPIGGWEFDSILDTASKAPATSGYGGQGGDGAYLEALADVSTLLLGIDQASLSLTRLNSELSREGLAGDLVLGASMQPIPTTLVAANYTGDACANASPHCHTPSSGSGNGNGDGAGGADGYEGDGGGGCDCSTVGTHASGGLTAALAALLAAAIRRQRKRAALRLG